MATFAELQSDIIALTKRPDLVADTKLAIKAADSDANAAWKWIDKYQAKLKYNKQDAIGK